MDVNLEKELRNIKRAKALKDCFKSKHFDICPINKLHRTCSYPNRKMLVRAHCVDLEQMTKEAVIELNRLAREAIYYDQPWYKKLFIDFI